MLYKCQSRSIGPSPSPCMEMTSSQHSPLISTALNLTVTNVTLITEHTQLTTLYLSHLSEIVLIFTAPICSQHANRDFVSKFFLDWKLIQLSQTLQRIVVHSGSQGASSSDCIHLKVRQPGDSHFILITLDLLFVSLSSR